MPELIIIRDAVKNMVNTAATVKPINTYFEVDSFTDPFIFFSDLSSSELK